ncbi:putative disease resistance RPP13-like protein 1 [Amaranthus tricolor]|uniref:putative disease resistance RPP13-like protein 1 n=1 Tax=Amaranthus tricolor TaxID=29722 RepID=UPI0025887537|nr:putative disease resistance RPP13-like protein 1 [Amaranthus tricolor]
MPISETILGAILSVVLDKLASKQVLNYLKSSKLDESCLKKLKHLMLVVEKLLADAEHKQTINPAVKSWLSELKHLFYRAEELVDEIATEAIHASMDASSRRKSLKTKVRNLIPPFSTSSSFAKIVNLGLKEIISQLEDMVSESSALNLREDYGSNIEVSTRITIPTSYMLDDTHVVGREHEKEEVLNKLLYEESERHKISVVAIVGMGGLGKTTLAKMVYNDDKLGLFNLKAWVHVSDQFDVSKVTKSILECITLGAYSGSLELSVLQYELSKMLKDNRFLLVLDDVWNEKYEDWDCLRVPFSLGARGSKVIVTTRNDGVATTMRTTNVIRLKPLSEEDGWLLFSKHALGVESSSSNLHSEFHDVGRKIVQKCSGLPLAIKTLGGLLWSKQDIKEWKVILESSVWDCHDGKSSIVPALRLSYYHLPSHLKQCFSYCALFPKGHRFDRKGLVLLWMAENFVQSIQRSRRIEDIGEDYVNQLISYSFFEKTDTNELLMHDLIHDLAQEISGDFLSRLENAQTTSEISEKTRYFSYFRDHYDIFSKFGLLHVAKYMRTFYQLPKWTSFAELGATYGICNCYLSIKLPIELIPRFHCLRVLSLSRYFVIQLPESIGNLKQLRFLDVSETGIKKLPKSICNLYHLQTLLLSQCKDLERLPENMSILMSLRHLDIRGTSSLREMPKQMRKLSSLQTMTDFVVSKHGGASIRELSELMQIRGELSIRSLQNVSSPDDALDANLSSRENLHVLALEYDDDNSGENFDFETVLEYLKPPANLEKLMIRNYRGKKFPSWLDTQLSMYTNVVNLCLNGCKNCNSLPPLGQLSSLMHLEIMGMDLITSVKAEFYAYNSGLSNPFPVLCSLVFKEMKSWEVWLGHEMEGKGLPFPRLETLTLQNCPKLKGDFPVHLPTLKELNTDGCDKLPNSFLHPLHCPPQSVSASSFHLSSLTSLKLHNLVWLASLPPQIETLSNLETMSIHNSPSLVSLAEIRLPPNIKCLKIKECEILESLPNAMVNSTQLREFSVEHCPCLSSNDEDTLPTSLSDLRIKSCARWKFSLFDSHNTSKMQQYSSLEFLRIINIGNAFASFPLGVLPKLQHLLLNNCTDLQAVYIATGIDLNNLKSLQRLIIKNNPILRYIGKTQSLGAVNLPTPNLRDFRVLSCNHVKPLTRDWEGLPSSHLEILVIDSFEKISSHKSTQTLFAFSCLRVLSIQCHVAEFLPEKGSLPITISTLSLVRCPNLKVLNMEELKRLKCLIELHILNCPNLICLPDEELPPTLGRLDIVGCPLLEARCERNIGRDWPKIRNLPCVKINRIVI